MCQYVLWVILFSFFKISLQSILLTIFFHFYWILWILQKVSSHKVEPEGVRARRRDTHWGNCTRWWWRWWCFWPWRRWWRNVTKLYWHNDDHGNCGDDQGVRKIADVSNIQEIAWIEGKRGHKSVKNTFILSQKGFIFRSSSNIVFLTSWRIFVGLRSNHSKAGPHLDWKSHFLQQAVSG